MAPGKGGSWTRTPGAPAPPTACPRGGRDRRANPNHRARTAHGPRPGAEHDNEPEQYGGRAPITGASPITPAMLPAQGGQRDGPRQHDPPAPWPPGHPPGKAAHGPPPPPPARLACRQQAAPGARGCPTTPTECIHLEGMRRRRNGGLGREPQAAPPREEGGEPRRDPPSIPAPPHRPASHGGAC